MSKKKPVLDKPISDPITLDTPVKRGEQTINEIRLRKPLSSEMRGLAMFDVLRMDNDTIDTLITRCSLPPILKEEAKELDPSDKLTIGQTFQSFFLKEEEYPTE